MSDEMHILRRRPFTQPLPVEPVGQAAKKMKKYALEAMLESLLIREGKPDSRALPRHKYQDPARHVKFEREKDMRRVKKEEVQIHIIPKTDGLDVCLECWKTWISSDGDRDLKEKLSNVFQGGGKLDMYEQEQLRNQEIGAATNAMIDSLNNLHRWAIYRLCSVANPWNYPNADLELIGPVAKYLLTEKLKKNTATRILF